MAKNSYQIPSILYLIIKLVLKAFVPDPDAMKPIILKLANVAISILKHLLPQAIEPVGHIIPDIAIAFFAFESAKAVPLAISPITPVGSYVHQLIAPVLVPLFPHLTFFKKKKNYKLECAPATERPVFEFAHIFIAVAVLHFAQAVV
jgi:hypothetical protein